MKKKLLVALSMILIVVLAACGGNNDNGDSGDTADNGDKKELRLAENQPEDYPTTIGDEKFADIVKDKTDGDIDIDVYAAEQLGDEKSVIEQVQLGTIDLARVNVSPMTQFSDEIGVLSMPYLFDDEEEKWDKLNGEVGQELLETLDGSNLVGLAFYDSGERYFYNTEKKITKPEDMKGMKIRVQESDIAIDTVEALGASATPMEYGEVYSSLQTGVIDGAENNMPSYDTSNHYEVAKYLNTDGYTGTPEILIASQDLWDSLSEEEQEILRDSAMESVDTQREAWADLTEESTEKVKEAGSEFSEAEDIEVWREAVQPVYDKYEDDFGDWIDKLTE